MDHGHGMGVMNETVIVEVAKKHGKSAAQVEFYWRIDKER